MHSAKLRMNSDLKLTLGPSNNGDQESLNAESGVGANAASRAELAFLGDDDPLAELVWSPRKGLTIRSAVGSALEKNSSIFWEAGPSKMVLSPPSYSIATENFIDNVAQKRDFAEDPDLVTASKGGATNTRMCKLDIGRDSGSSEKMMEMNTTVGPNSLRDEGNSNTITVAETTGSNSPGVEDGRTSNVIPVSDELHLYIRPTEFLPGCSTDMKICGSLDINNENGKTCPLSPMKGNLYQEVQDLRNSKVLNTQELVRSNTTTGNKLQSPSDSEQFQLEVCPVNKHSLVSSFTSKRKGKEKSVEFNGDMKEEAVEDSKDSYESVESCNTLRLAGARKNRAEQSIVGCKILKLQNQETPGFTPFTRGDGSFVNWISTLTKDLSRPVKKKGLIVRSGEQDHKRGNMGLQSLFGSLYQPNPKAQDQTLLSCDDHNASEGCKNLEVAGNNGSHLSTRDSVKEHNQLSNLWLTHFCPKSSGLIQNSGKPRLGEELKKCPIPLDVESSCRVKRIEGKKFNPMASIFAKRVDALKQIMQTNLVDKATSSTTTTCFFCGIFGHDLQNCPQVTNTEVNELLNDMTNYSGAEESCCFCIKCFQLNHWDVACPNAVSVNKSEILHLELPDEIDVNLEIGESSASLRRRRISPNLEKVGFYCDEEDASKAPSICHPCSSSNKPRGIFEAVRNLRLSRIDILKWMYSMVSLSNLDGYYVRLWLGKPEEGLGGIGYYVACISGLQGVESVETSEKPISVIVGGVKCSIESQYISNQDFSEDELMAWWSVTIKGGGKIPLEDELMMKVMERKRLGL